MCVNYLCHIRNIMNVKYKWMRVDTIYNIISNILLFHILHIRRGDIYGTQHEIASKLLSVINTVREQALYLTTNR